jgi:hypothetical protein
MPKFKIYAQRVTHYELEVEAKDYEKAYASMDEMIADDFEPYEVANGWEFEILADEEA